MSEEELKAVIYNGLRKVAPESEPSALGAGQNLREVLDIDSFDFLSFLIGLHEALGVEIPEADYGKLGSIEGLVAYLRARAV
jgi:acyl carrier protein